MPEPPPEPASPLWIEALGWAGMLAILSAYSASAFGMGADKSFLATINAAGASGVALACWKKRAWPAMFLEIAWASVALATLAGLGPRAGLPLAALLSAAVGALAVRLAGSSAGG